MIFLIFVGQIWFVCSRIGFLFWMSTARFCPGFVGFLAIVICREDWNMLSNHQSGDVRHFWVNSSGGHRYLGS